MKTQHHLVMRNNLEMTKPMSYDEAEEQLEALSQIYDKKTLLIVPTDKQVKAQVVLTTKPEEVEDKLDAKDKIVVLGDMFELGDSSLDEHKKIVERLKNMNLYKVILIGRYFAEAAKDTNFTIYKSIGDASKDLNLENFDNVVFLIKGSRGMSLERLLR